MQLILDEFTVRKDHADRLVYGAHRTKTNGAYLRSKIERQALTEHAFLKFFIAWEYYLERIVLRYSLGDTSNRGNPANRRILPQNEEHSYDLIRGKSPFVEWGNIDQIRMISKLFFDNGQPFEIPLSSVSRDLMEAKIIRNAIAHIGTTTQKKLEDLTVRKTGTPYIGITPYDLVMMPGVNGTLFSDYTSVIETAAHDIANF